jgi:hypothetical protein
VSKEVFYPFQQFMFHIAAMKTFYMTFDLIHLMVAFATHLSAVSVAGSCFLSFGY